MKVHLYTIVWNEEEMLPFFFRHYDPIVDRYIIYDDHSTDRTLEMLAAHDRVEIRPFRRTIPDSYVLSAQSLHNSVWKESRGRADWVIVTAVDEHLYHPAGLSEYLATSRARGITALPALAFEMFSETFPSDKEHLATTVRNGIPLDSYNKLNIFDPNFIQETKYEVGRHTAAPEGEVKFPDWDELLLFHYKFLGIEYLSSRYVMLAGGLGPLDRERTFGHQYDLGTAEIENYFKRLRQTAGSVTSAASPMLERKRWWRPTV